MTDKPRWTRERKPKRRVVRGEIGKKTLRDQLATVQFVLGEYQKEQDRLREEVAFRDEQAKDRYRQRNVLQNRVNALELQRDALLAELRYIHEEGCVIDAVTAGRAIAEVGVEGEK